MPITSAPAVNEPRINDKIRAREVRLVDPDGNQLGIKPLPEALAIARDLDLDLVEVAPQANPPVCRVMDYGKFKFDAAQRARESRRKASNVGIKEMKYRPKIGDGDFETKTRRVLKFLAEGHKVKVTIMFRGREVFHPELGRRILDRIAERVDGTAKVETEARLDGRNMVMVLAPDKRALQSAAARSGRHPDEAPEGTVEAPAGPATAADPDAAGPAAAGPAAAGPDEVGPEEVGQEEVGQEEVGPEEVGPEEVGPAEVGAAEVGPATADEVRTGSDGAGEAAAADGRSDAQSESRPAGG